MKLHAVVNQGNESERYLQAFFEWNKQWWDTLFVYDDQTTDESQTIARDYADYVVIRGDAHGFSDHEGLFRQQSWACFERNINPADGDWVFAIDCDEFLVPNDYDVLVREITTASDAGKNSVGIVIPEIWDTEGGLYHRVDGYWPGQRSGRLFRYLKGGEFRHKVMGCGSMPTYAELSMLETEDIHLLHFGYAREADRISKHERYDGLPGHNPKHIASIIQKPKLELWEGQQPVWQL